MIPELNYISTRNHAPAVSFSQALFDGLASDGGLYQFRQMPNFSDFFNSLGNAGTPDFREIAAYISKQISSREMIGDIDQIIQEAYDFEPKLKPVTDNLTVLELFHGPSCAFKDFGACFLASAMNRLLNYHQKKRAIIVTATSGDTGSAVAQAFWGKPSIDVIILYPSKRITPLQEKQLTTLGGNVTALEVSGSFDDCQRMAKSVFTNPNLSNLPLSSANSINLGRLIPQSYYYIWAWARMKKHADIAFVVPSGNFGNLTAGLYAKTWGLPVNRYFAATNANDIIPEYLKTGVYSPRPSVKTLSNAMDVGTPSNYERLDSLYDKNIEIFRRHVQAASATDEQTKEAIAQAYRNYGYLCCPHTAVGWHVAEIFHQQNPKTHVILLSTAHPGKFVETVEAATGEKPLLPEPLLRLADKKKVSISISNNDIELEHFLLDTFQP